MVCEAVEAADGLELSGRADPAGGIALDSVITGADVLIDFTTPDVALGNAFEALDAGVHVVMGTTGFDLLALEEKAGSASANVFVAPNFAIGAVLLMEFARQAAASLGPCEIIEFHHEEKKDRPSGTAARTRELIQEAGGQVNDPLDPPSGAGRSSGGDLRRTGRDPHDQARLDRSGLLHARRRARCEAGRGFARPVHDRPRGPPARIRGGR